MRPEGHQATNALIKQRLNKALHDGCSHGSMNEIVNEWRRKHGIFSLGDCLDA